MMHPGEHIREDHNTVLLEEGMIKRKSEQNPLEKFAQAMKD
jgi:hypothetical protein